MKSTIVILVALSVLMAGCAVPNQNTMKERAKDYDPESVELATFAGGCFWCMEHPFEEYEGVLDVISGFSGGVEEDPSYKEVASGKTSHAEAVQITYDPKKITYRELLDIFWRQIDPTDADGQFVDRGKQYRSAIFYHNKEQKELAEASKQALEASGKYDKPLVTEIVKFTSFYPAEAYHQNYYKEHPLKYKFYRSNSGRDQYLEKIWGNEDTMFRKPSEEELRKILTPLQFKVTQQDGTEKPFDNKYNDNKEEGIYVDLVSGEPLFSSLDKYDSKTGWPSFTKPLEAKNIVEKKDFKLIFPRVEVRSKQADSHLGHIFKDGPAPTGLRYCINSAALRFISKEDLEKEGYGDYLKLFD